MGELGDGVDVDEDVLAWTCRGPARSALVAGDGDGHFDYFGCFIDFETADARIVLAGADESKNKVGDPDDEPWRDAHGKRRVVNRKQNNDDRKEKVRHPKPVIRNAAAENGEEEHDDEDW